jgi:hypothetical protein
VSARRAVLLGLLVACGGGGHGSGGGTGGGSGGEDGGSDAGGCPVLNPACPTPPPSYASQVAPIIKQACLPCHTPGQQPYAAPFALNTWQGVSGLHGTVVEQLYICAMPNGDGGPAFVLDGGPVLLSNADKLTVMDWCLCGAPNN